MFRILGLYCSRKFNFSSSVRDATTTMNAESYGYVRRDSSLVPEFVILKPDNLPDLCTYGKCARKNGC